VSFSYGQESASTTVYLENGFSAAFKLELVQAFRLGGVAIADASGGTDVANVWPAVRSLVEAGAPLLLRPNGEALIPIWLAPDGGDIDAGNGAALWRPEDVGQYTIELIVSDGVLRFGRRLSLAVTEAPTPTPAAEETPPELETETPTPSPSSEVDAAPERVAGLSVTPGGGGQLLLGWSASAEPDLASYRVYRSTTPNGPFILVATVAGGITNYVDQRLVANAVYFYRVTAVDVGGTEGPPAEGSATAP
jgi:hypothetical protein